MKDAQSDPVEASSWGRRLLRLLLRGLGVVLGSVVLTSGWNVSTRALVIGLLVVAFLVVASFEIKHDRRSDVGG